MCGVEFPIPRDCHATDGLKAAVSSTDARLLENSPAGSSASPSPVVELNRAVAIAMRDGPAAALALIEAILDRCDPLDCHPAHAARADLCRRPGRAADARVAYERALHLARQMPERRFLERRLAEPTN
jgi:predicted RNA polymerase sigma factor